MRGSPPRFLLAQLHLGSLSGKTTIKAVKTAVQNLPKGSDVLEIAYGEALKRIDTQKLAMQQLAKQALSWIVCAARQLEASELQVALAVEEGTSELDEENKSDLDDIVSACAGLVTIDENSNIIRLVHYTTQEYFDQTLSDWAPTAHVKITETCLTYLSFDAFARTPDARLIRRYSRELDNLSRKNLFLEYALLYWHIHAKRCWNESIEERLLSFLNDKGSIIRAYDPPPEFRHPGLGFPTRFEPIHCAAYLGLERLMSTLLKSGHDPQLRDSHWLTPLAYAAYKGELGIVELLLNIPRLDVNVNDKTGRTPLHLASAEGRENVVRILLEVKEINANQKDRSGETPLLAAVRFDHVGVVQLLVARDDVDVNSLSSWSESALSIACNNVASSRSKTAETIVEILLKREDILTTSRDNSGGTPLTYVAKVGCERIANLLLARNDVANNTEYLSYSLVRACYFSDSSLQTIERLLRMKNTQVNYRDRFGETALTESAKRGSEALVKLLLTRDDICVNDRGLLDRTALMWAARRGQTGVVKLLLERDDIDMNCRNYFNETALMLAYENGHEKVVGLLEKAGAEGEVPEVGLRSYGKISH